MLAVVVLASLFSLVGPRSGFTTIRLVAQALFGEVLLLTAFVAPSEWRYSRPRASAAFVLPLGLLSSYWEGYHREPHLLQLTRHGLDLSRSSSAGHLRVLHLSDLQAHQVGAYEERVVEEAQRLRPDLVVWTGDYVQPRLEPTRRETTTRLRALIRRQTIDAPLGHYAVRGDVDVDWPSVFDGTRVRCLTDEGVRIDLPGGRSLRLIGLGSGMSRGRDPGSLTRLMDTFPHEDLTVVAGHQPDFVRLLPGVARVDLVLAGHTHGGQVVLPFFGAPYTKSNLPRRYARGLDTFKGIPIHVSAGIGMERGTAPQIRFLCPPEICLLEIRY